VQEKSITWSIEEYMNRFSKSMLVAGVTVLSALLVAPSAQALDFKLHSINLSNPGELPEGIDPSDLLADSLKIPKLPLGFEMPEPGSMPGTPVACLQKGKLDIKRPSLPLITCSETIPVGKATSAALQEAGRSWLLGSRRAPLPKGSPFTGDLHRRQGWQQRRQHHHQQPLPLHPTKPVRMDQKSQEL
jgi:hypothetical protein